MSASFGWNINSKFILVWQHAIDLYEQPLEPTSLPRSCTKNSVRRRCKINNTIWYHNQFINKRLGSSRESSWSTRSEQSQSSLVNYTWSQSDVDLTPRFHVASEWRFPPKLISPNSREESYVGRLAVSHVHVYRINAVWLIYIVLLLRVFIYIYVCSTYS